MLPASTGYPGKIPTATTQVTHYLLIDGSHLLCLIENFYTLSLFLYTSLNIHSYRSFMSISLSSFDPTPYSIMPLSQQEVLQISSFLIALTLIQS